jgi:hypothetical protein
LARNNYQYEKRQKDIAKKKKQDEKRQKKLNKKSDGTEETPENADEISTIDEVVKE